MQDPPARAQRSFFERARLIRELIIFVASLLLGLVVVPVAIWFAGSRILGPYPHGSNPNAGPMALLGDFFFGLSQGALTFWAVAVGPLVIILFVRLAWAAIKSNPRPRQSVAKDRL